MAWAGPRNDAGILPADTVAIGLEDDDGIRIVTYFNHFTEHNASMHVVTDGGPCRFTRGFLAAAFAYPFIQLKLNRVTAYVAAKNLRALTFDLKLGFQVEGRMPEAEENDDVVILGMLRRNCPWIPQEHRNG